MLAAARNRATASERIKRDGPCATAKCSILSSWLGHGSDA